MSHENSCKSIPLSAVSISPKADTPPCRYAARELARLLARSGVAVYTDKADFTFPAYSIILSHTSERNLQGGAFRLTVSESETTLECFDDSGFVYGSYALLEKMGFAFYTQDLEIIPAAPLYLPVGVFEEHPAFETREVFWREALDGAFAVKLRLNTARSSITAEMGGKAPFYNFSHSFSQLVPPEIYFEAHPEYFSEINGVRIRERTQLCLTNPEVQRICIEGVLRWKKENPACSVFSVSMNDWYNQCTCSVCRAVDEEEESAAGTVLRFVNAVAEATQRVYPDIRIHTFAYLYCRKAPKITKPRDNVIVRLCDIECCFSHPLETCGYETNSVDVQQTLSRRFIRGAGGQSAFMRDLRDWSRICSSLYVWDYTTNYANYLQPFPNLHVLQANLRTFRKYGVKGVLEQGNFSLGAASAMGDLKVYLLAKLLWNPDDDVQALTENFLRGVFKEGADAMQRYIRVLEEAAEKTHMSIYDFPDAPYLADDVLTKAEDCLQEALRRTRGAEHVRVLKEQLSLRYVRLAQETPDSPEHAARVNAFKKDTQALGITELFERRDLDGSFEALKNSRFTRDRSGAKPISYPL